VTTTTHQHHQHHQHFKQPATCCKPLNTSKRRWQQQGLETRHLRMKKRLPGRNEGSRHDSSGVRRYVFFLIVYIYINNYTNEHTYQRRRNELGLRINEEGGLETCRVSSPRCFLYIEMAGARDRRVSSPLVVIYKVYRI
jgi:hypothetical protein